MAHANETASQLEILSQFRPLPTNITRHVLLHDDTSVDKQYALGSGEFGLAARGKAKWQQSSSGDQQQGNDQQQGSDQQQGNRRHLAREAWRDVWHAGVELVARDLHTLIVHVASTSPDAAGARTQQSPAHLADAIARCL